MRPMESTLVWRSSRAPDQVWAALTAVDAYRDWWPWLEGLEGASPAPGVGLYATIRAPARYRVRCMVRFTEVDRPHRLAAEIEGDLGGWARIELHPDGTGSFVRLRWSLHPARPLLRVLGVVAEPILVHGHDRIMGRGTDQFVAGSGMDLSPVDRASGVTTGPRAMGDVAWASLVAGALSGLPSTVHALATGRDPLAAARAAGSLLGRPTLIRGVVVHAALSLGWAAALAAVLPRRGAVVTGAAAGAVIAALDLGVVGRRRPTIRALPVLPQVADHIAFGALTGAVLARRAGRVEPHRPRDLSRRGAPPRR
jgi:uncharacterized protein YndB with AHSA1/START domain